MNLLVIADVHGCFFTLKKLIKTYWDEENTLLILVGDIINKGLHSVKTISYLRKLHKKFPNKVIVLRGNHEQMFLNLKEKKETNSYLTKFMREMKLSRLSIRKSLDWISSFPSSWENNYVLISHAGIAKSNKRKIDLNAKDSIINNRSELKNIGKLQIFGHVIQDYNQPRFFPESNSWGIDTGCWLGGGLTAMLIGSNGNIIEIIRQPTFQSDL
ncbi:MAG: metallophosphoesterase family protein [Schleiferiaceae bacterium]|jgi:serine/threonine protein phosphatase 1|tara:strand:+ start:50162 stop:50803 length:642 start_codon:yes stop_codon:yes gene_type:complete